MVISGNYTPGRNVAAQNVPLDPFDTFVASESFSAALERFEELLYDINVNVDNFYGIGLLYKLRKSITTWKAKQLLDKICSRSENAVYFPTRADAIQLKKRVAEGKKCLIIGAGPCGLRTAIEMAFLGAQVHVVDSRKEFSRNNILHLWPFCIADLKALGAKSFFGKFCSGAIDHVPIRRLQLILCKVALLLGVKFTREVFCDEVAKDAGGNWTVRLRPHDPGAEISAVRWDTIVDSTGGSAGTSSILSPDLARKEFRGLLAIGITVNFKNFNSAQEARVEEISGVASIYKQHFFKQLRNTTGIDLENIVYYKDETHYFVMTARAKSLYERGVLLNHSDNSETLLSRSNIDPNQLQNYALDAANFATNYKLKDIFEFETNSRGNPDVSIFDFTSRYHSKYAAIIRRCRGRDVLGLLVGDSLINPFWPTGTGIGKGFLGVFDACWTFREFCLGKKSQQQILQEREVIYKILDSCDPGNSASALIQKFAGYTIDPKTRYNLLGIGNRSENVPILFVEEDHKSGKKRSLAPNDPFNTKRSRCGTMKDQETQVLNWMRAVMPLEKKYRNCGLQELPWKTGSVLLNLIKSIRPDWLANSESPKKMNATAKVELALSVCEEQFSLQKIGAPKDFVRSKPDLLMLITTLTQIKNAYQSAPLVNPQVSDASAVRKSSSKPSKKSNAKKSLEQSISKMANSLKRRSTMASHVKKSSEEKSTKENANLPNDNFAEADAKMLSDLERQDKVDEIIVQHNVPQPKPRTKFPIRRSKTAKPFTPLSTNESLDLSGISETGISEDSDMILSDARSSSGRASSIHMRENRRSPAGSQLSPRGEIQLGENYNRPGSRHSIAAPPSSSASSGRVSAKARSRISVALSSSDWDQPATSSTSSRSSNRLPLNSSKNLPLNSSAISIRSVRLNDEEDTPRKKMPSTPVSPRSNSPFDEFETQILEGGSPDSPPASTQSGMASLPHFASFQSPQVTPTRGVARTTAVRRKIIPDPVEESVKGIDRIQIGQTAQKANGNIKMRQNKSRVVRPVTWTPEKEQSSESDDDIYEMEQLTRRRQLKAQTVQRQLEEVAVRQMQLEEQSANIERQIRSETINDSTELMEQWFQTIEEKNQLLRRENELMIEQRYLQLEDQQQAVAATIRERLKLPEKQKSERDKKEDQLLSGVRKCSFPRYHQLRRTSTLYVKHIEHSIV